MLSGTWMTRSGDGGRLVGRAARPVVAGRAVEDDQPVVIWVLDSIAPLSPLPLLSVITVDPTGSFIS